MQLVNTVSVPIRQDDVGEMRWQFFKRFLNPNTSCQPNEESGLCLLHIQNAVKCIMEVKRFKGCQ